MGYKRSWLEKKIINLKDEWVCVCGAIGSGTFTDSFDKKGPSSAGEILYIHIIYL